MSKLSVGVTVFPQYSDPDACTLTVVPDVEVFSCGTEELHTRSSGVDPSRHWVYKNEDEIKIQDLENRKCWYCGRCVDVFGGYRFDIIWYGSAEIYPEKFLKEINQ